MRNEIIKEGVSMYQYKTRLSNFELLRILAMVSIVFFHYSDHGCANMSLENANEFNFIFQSLFRFGGYGNCTFVLLTGYFMVTSRVTAEKAFRLWLQVFTYSILSLIIYYVVTGDTHTRHIFIALTPISHNWYWFFTSYLILFLCSPVINQGIINLTKRQFLALTLVLLFFFSVLPTFGHGYLIDSNRIGLFFLYIALGLG